MPDDGRGVIGRSVVDDDDLERRGLIELTGERGERRPDVVGGILRGKDHRSLRPHSTPVSLVATASAIERPRSQGTVTDGGPGGERTVAGIDAFAGHSHQNWWPRMREPRESAGTRSPLLGDSGLSGCPASARMLRLRHHASGLRAPPHLGGSQASDWRN